MSHPGPPIGPDGEIPGDTERPEEPGRAGGRKGFLTRMARGASERVLDVVQPDRVLEHVDVNALLERVDVNLLLDRVDVNTLLDRVDIDALLARADIDALMNRVDVQAMAERAGIPEIVAESTGHLTGSALDLFRKPIVGIDEITFRGLNRLVGRDPNQFPEGPGELTAWVDEKVEAKVQSGVGRARPPGTTKTGRYAGPVTRLLAVMLDVFVVTTGFTVIVSVIRFLVDLLSGGSLTIPDTGLWYAIGLGVWAFLYVWLSLAIFGKTIGKAVLGLRVVGADGTALQGKRALVRTVTFPISVAVVGLGLFGIVWGRERRAWHDHLAGSAVVYDWGSRAAQMPSPLADWLERRGAAS
ncbi:MAG: RDD family protein [Actinomycetota bacterium]|nr:RDD family protein [Actinomycetota bacterium]